ncbi:MAG: SLC13 family permease [Actinomycetota bacterium]|nr:SLC13 family permease [Actinomycetota bacterium]
MADLAALAVTVPLLVLALIVAARRPGTSAEAGVSVLGAAFAVFIGAIGGGPATDEVYDVGEILVLFCVLLVLGHLADAEGVFIWAVAVLARGSRRSPLSMLRRTVLLAAVTSAILGANATLVLLTPVVVTTVIRMRQRVRPHAYACAHLGNSASLLMPVSSLTNLLAFTAAGLSFLHFTALMALPWLVAVLVEYALLRRVFAAGPTAPEVEGAPEAPSPPRLALVVLALIVLGFAVGSLIGVAPIWPAAAGVAILALRRLIAGTSTAAAIIESANLSVALFILGVAVLVRGIRESGLDDVMTVLLPGVVNLPTLLAVAVIAALLSSAVGNVTAALALVPAAAMLGAPAILAVLIGVNVGANLTYIGSFANLAWRRILEPLDEAPSALRFSAVGLLTVPATLIASTTALWLSWRLFG